MSPTGISQSIEARYGTKGFPVSDCLPTLIRSLERHSLVALTAPPGSGKTLLVPSALLEGAEFPRIWVLEPRRVTARLPALALREVLGSLVGYRIRFESLWDNRETRLGYLTYGTALRRFFSHPPAKAELVVFDEFHERSWEAELLLAYLRRLDDGPKILLMSATLDRESLPTEVPVVESDGRLHRVETSWESTSPQHLGKRERLSGLVALRSAEWAKQVEGEQLIFLPGLADIRATESLLLADSIPGPVDILHSSLPEKELRRVVEQPVHGKFRRILSTDIAESSITLPGIKVVIDSGLTRRPIRNQLDLGITLRTVGAPLSALQQRAGRAGRMGPGFCHRLFTREEEIHRDPFPLPEMSQADYKTVALFLASQSLLQDCKSLPWLYPPDEERLALSWAWCAQRKLITSSGKLSSLGRRVLSLPLEPRIATFACIAQTQGMPTHQIIDYCQALERPPSGPHSLSLHEWSRTIKAQNGFDSRLQSVLKRALPSQESSESASLSELLLYCFKDTLAQLSNDRAVCSNPNQTALEIKHSPNSSEAYAVLLSTSPKGGAGPKSFVNLYHPLSADLLWEHMFEEIKETRSLIYDHSNKSVKSERKLTIGQLLLEQSVESAQPGLETATLLLQHLTQSELGQDYATLRRRLELFFIHQPESLEELSQSLAKTSGEVIFVDHLLLSYLSTITRWSKSSAGDLVHHILGLLPYSFRQTLEQKLPSHVTLPGRKRAVEICYPQDGDPYLASKLQDFFGWEQPELLDGKVELVCKLLAPNGRACQITTDLQTFWAGSYQQVRKDLRGRYPKHHWPEDPLKSTKD